MIIAIIKQAKILEIRGDCLICDNKCHLKHLDTHFVCQKIVSGSDKFLLTLLAMTPAFTACFC